MSASQKKMGLFASARKAGITTLTTIDRTVTTIDHATRVAEAYVEQWSTTQLRVIEVEAVESRDVTLKEAVLRIDERAHEIDSKIASMTPERQARFTKLYQDLDAHLRTKGL